MIFFQFVSVVLFIIVSSPKLYLGSMTLVLLVGGYHLSATSQGGLRNFRLFMTASHKSF